MEDSGKAGRRIEHSVPPPLDPPSMNTNSNTIRVQKFD